MNQKIVCAGLGSSVDSPQCQRLFSFDRSNKRTDPIACGQGLLRTKELAHATNVLPFAGQGSV